MGYEKQHLLLLFFRHLRQLENLRSVLILLPRAKAGYIETLGLITDY